MSKRVAMLRVCTSMLISRLGLPGDTKIHDCRMSFNASGVVEFKIEHETLDPVEDGNIMPAVSAMYSHDGFVKYV